MPRPAREDRADDGPSAADLERFGDVTRPCPNCGKSVYDDAEQCYHCGHALGAMDESARVPAKRLVLVALLVLALVGGLLIGVLRWF